MVKEEPHTFNDAWFNRCFLLYMCSIVYDINISLHTFMTYILYLILFWQWVRGTYASGILSSVVLRMMLLSYNLFWLLMIYFPFSPDNPRLEGSGTVDHSSFPEDRCVAVWIPSRWRTVNGKGFLDIHYLYKIVLLYHCIQVMIA